jgi:riboflavin transporter FmnP
VSTPSGTSIDPSGAVIDAIALVVFVVIAWSLWRDRRSLA